MQLFRSRTLIALKAFTLDVTAGDLVWLQSVPGITTISSDVAVSSAHLATLLCGSFAGSS